MRIPPTPSGFTTLPGGSTVIPGWTIGGHSVDYIGNYWMAQDGTHSIDLAGNGIGSLAQTFATTAGNLYNLSFWIGRNPDGGIDPRTGSLSVGGVVIPLLYSGTGGRANMQWQNVIVPFNATSGSTTINFAADASSSNFFGLALDSVSISSPVPEPATWLTLILGFGLLGGALRRTKSQTRTRIAFG